MLAGYGDRTRRNKQLRDLNLARQRVEPAGSLRMEFGKDSTRCFDRVLVEARSARVFSQRNTVRPGEYLSSMPVGVAKRAGNPPGFLRPKRPDSLTLLITTLFVDLEDRLFATISDDQPDVPSLRLVVERADRSVLKLRLVGKN